MATSIISHFDSIYLSAHLPETVSFRTDAASLQVDIYVNDNKVFSSDYYPFEGIVKVRDICSIVEAAMLEDQLAMTSLKIVATEPTDPISVTTDDIKVIYSRFLTNDSSEGFLTNRFLTTRHSALIPRDGQLNLSNYAQAYAQDSNVALIYYYHYAVPGVVYTYNFAMPKIQSTTEQIVTASLSHEYFKAIVDEAKSTNCKVLGVEYRIGTRRFNIFFTDEQPTDVFTFLNAFNIEETVYLYGTTTMKTEVDRTETVCGKKTEFYDETVKTKHEVETAPLPYDEAKWLNQMLTSKYVTRPLGEGQSSPILLSDISSEVSNSDKDLIRLKFSWKYAEGIEYI